MDIAAFVIAVLAVFISAWAAWYARAQLRLDRKRWHHDNEPVVDLSASVNPLAAGAEGTPYQLTTLLRRGGPLRMVTIDLIGPRDTIFWDTVGLNPAEFRRHNWFGVHTGHSHDWPFGFYSSGLPPDQGWDLHVRVTCYSPAGEEWPAKVVTVPVPAAPPVPPPSTAPSKATPAA